MVPAMGVVLGEAEVMQHPQSVSNHITLKDKGKAGCIQAHNPQSLM